MERHTSDKLQPAPRARERVRQTTKTPRAARPGEAGCAFVGPSGLNPDRAFPVHRVMALRPRLRRSAARPLAGASERVKRVERVDGPVVGHLLW